MHSKVKINSMTFLNFQKFLYGSDYFKRQTILYFTRPRLKKLCMTELLIFDLYNISSASSYINYVLLLHVAWQKHLVHINLWKFEPLNQTSQHLPIITVARNAKKKNILHNKFPDVFVFWRCHFYQYSAKIKVQW